MPVNQGFFEIINHFSLKDNKPEFIIEGDLKRYLSYIEMGSNLHIGKKTTYGFGQYEYEIIE